VVKGEQRWHKFFKSNLELAEYIIAEDARGRTVYHACACFVLPTKRTHDNVEALRSFWVDADVGENKPFKTVHEAGQAIATFCKALSIPLPVPVGSGYGLHCYWPLDEDIDPETWQRYAHGFRALCHQHKLAVDHNRTGDMSSILRTPGTHNRKHETAKAVIGGQLSGPFPLSAFDVFLTATPQFPQRNGVPSLSSDLLGGLYADRPSDADRVITLCRQVARLKETGGKLPEPIWRATAGVLVFCTNGRERMHEHSSGDERYTVSNTDEYLDRAKAFGSPITCAHFRDLNPAGCVGCPASGRITSPVELGRLDQPDKPGKETSGSVGLHGELIRLPPPDFAYDTKGALQLISESKTGKTTEELVCQHPVYLKSLHTGELDDTQFGYLFRNYIPCQGWSDVVVPAKKALGYNAVGELANLGIEIHQVEYWRKFVRESVGQRKMDNAIEKRFDQFGWKDDDTAFLVGRRLYTSDGIKEVNGNDTLQQRSQYLDFPKSKSTSLERWQRAANKMFAAGFEHQSLAILCGFAAPLMRFHSEEEGGAIVSFISDKTNSGKTTALEAAASVWGHHRGLKLDDSDTRVAKGLKLGLLGNLPCTFDELYQRDPEEIRKFVIAFTNGMDKDRGTVDGGLRVNKADWQTILLLSSNKSIVDTVSNLDASDAPAARVFELYTQLPPGSNEDDFERTRRELNHNYGFAGHEFMTYLMQPGVIPDVKQKIDTYAKAVRKSTGLEAKHRFWIRMIVSVIIAGTIVQKIGLLDFSIERIRDWLLATARNQKHQILSSSDNDAVSTLGEFINHYFDNTLIVDGNKPGVWGKPVIMLHEPRGKLFIRKEMDNQRMYIVQSELKKWLSSKSIGISHFIETLLEQHVILREGRKHTLGAGTIHAGLQVACYEINMANPLFSGVPVLWEKARPDLVADPAKEDE
jgi:hypothetical protein